MSELAYALGRVMIPVMFLISGIGKFGDITRTATMIAQKGLPQSTLLAYAAGTVEILGAIMIMIGFRARWAALALIGFTAAATYFFHPFWTMSGDAYRLNQILALKNLAVMGALLLLAAHGAGRYSLDRR